MRKLRLALAQINCVVGDLDGNFKKICRSIEGAREQGADMLALPELAIVGYPPEDLLLKDKFVTDNLSVLSELARFTAGASPVVVVGFVDRDERGRIYNAAAVLHDGKIKSVYHKVYLPNYGVFDEKRYFAAGDAYPVHILGDTKVGITICEDIWHPEGPALIQSQFGDADLIVNINASPYHIGKGRYREKMLAERAADAVVVIAYVNMCGGQDELVFDGHSLVVGADGKILARGGQFVDELLVVDIDLTVAAAIREKKPAAASLPESYRVKTSLVDLGVAAHDRPGLQPADLPPLLDEDEEIWKALVTGVRDYSLKNGFKKALIGLSGGVDSALTAAVAAGALGAANVTGVFMPSPYTSAESGEDAAALAASLKIEMLTIPISETFAAYKEMLKPAFAGEKADITEENLQARIRGNTLMAISNKFGHLVLSTGNKSEMSVGYATLYGDMSGGFAVLKDVPKTLVYRLCRFLNRDSIAIPGRILTKEPTAELRSGQLDSDNLPPYDILDPILKSYVEDNKSAADIVAAGFEPDMVKRIIGLVDRAEYKRRQSPPGVKITVRAFGKDRRLPITNLYGG